MENLASSVQVVVKPHPLASKEVISAARKTAKAFASQLEEEGKVQGITAVEVTWTPYGQFGGILVTKAPEKGQKKDDIVVENKENQVQSCENTSSKKRKAMDDEELAPSIKLTIKMPRFY